MPAHEIVIHLPELRWGATKAGGYRFEAGDAERGFEATVEPGSDVLTAHYRYDGDGGRGDYTIGSVSDLESVLGDMILFAAGITRKEYLGAMAIACVRDGQLPFPDLTHREDD